MQAINQKMSYFVPGAFLNEVAEAIGELEDAKQFYVDQPDRIAQISAHVERLRVGVKTAIDEYGKEWDFLNHALNSNDGVYRP